MAKIEKLTPGQTVYKRRRQKMGNTTISYTALYAVSIIEINVENRKVLASWNSNSPQWYNEHSVSAWLVNKPEPKKTVLGMNSY